MFRFNSYADQVEGLGKPNVQSRMTDEQFIVTEINRFHISKKFKAMIDGEKYYKGQHDILFKQRTAIGDDGKLINITNLPNNRIIDNQYKKMVDQKVQYLLGQPFVLRSEDEKFLKEVKPYIQTKKFFKFIKSIGKDLVNSGIAWVYPHYDDRGEFVITRLKPYEIIPEWADAEHTILEAAIRVYEVVSYEGKLEKIIKKVEVFDEEGIHYFELTDGGGLIPEAPYLMPYFTMDNRSYNWDKIPLIPFRFNEDEIPMIAKCKSMQDSLNQIESQWQDQMEEDPRNTIMVLVNYDGQNLGEFRRNLAQYGAVKVRSAEGGSGDVRTLQVQVNSENYKAIIAQFKKAIIENCMGYDAKDDRLGGNANEMNIKSMYSDIELDANDMETEIQASFEELMWFLECHLFNIGKGDFEGVDYEIIFNRDIMINESSVINDVKNSMGIVSTETLLAQHPWIDDVAKELKKLEDEKAKSLDLYGDLTRANEQ